MNGYALWSILLLIFGLTTLIAEIFIPSGGALAVITVMAIVGSLVLSAVAWLWTAPLFFAAHFSLVLVLVPLCLLGALELLPRTRAGKRMILEGPNGDRLKAPQASTEEKLASLVGRRGLARTSLSPGGYVSIGDARYSAISGESLIDPGTHIIVTGVRGSTLVVSPSMTAPEVPESIAAAPEELPTSSGEAGTMPPANDVQPALEQVASSLHEAQIHMAEVASPPQLPASEVELDPFAQLASDSDDTTQPQPKTS